MNAFFNSIKDMLDSFAGSLTANYFLYIVMAAAFGVFAVFFLVSFFLYRDRTMRKLKAITRKVERTEITGDTVWDIRGEVAEIAELDRGMTEVAAGLGRAKPSRYLKFSAVKLKSTDLCFIIYNIVMFLITAAVVFLSTGYMTNYPVQGIFTISLLLGMQAIYFGIFAISEEVRKRKFARVFENFVSVLEKKCNDYKSDPRAFAKEDEEKRGRVEIVNEQPRGMRGYQPQAQMPPMGQMPPRPMQMPPQGGMVPPMGQQVPPRSPMQPMGAPTQQAQGANFAQGSSPQMMGRPFVGNPTAGYRPGQNGPIAPQNSMREEEKFDVCNQEEKDEAIEIDILQKQENREPFVEKPRQEREDTTLSEDEPGEEEIDDAVIDEIIKDAEFEDEEESEDASQDEEYIEDASEDESESEDEEEEQTETEDDEEEVSEDEENEDSEEEAEEEDLSAEAEEAGEEDSGAEAEQETQEEAREIQKPPTAESPYKGAYETKTKEEKSVVEEEFEKIQKSEEQTDEGMIAKDDKDEIAKYLESKRKRERIVVPEPKPAQQSLTGTDRTMQQIALLLQKEREKKSSKNPEEQKRINEALTDLLREIGKSGKQ